MKDKQIIQIALLVFFSFIFSIGNNSMQAQNLDSLWSAWQDEESADTLRLQAMDDLIMKGYVFSQPDSAYALAQMAYDYADSVGNKKYIAAFLNILGIACAMLDHYSRATDYFLNSKNMYEEIGNTSGLSIVLSNLASLYDRIGEKDKALQMYKQGLTILTEIGDERNMIFPLINMGYNYANTNHLDSALESFEHALRLGEKYDFSPGKLNSISGIGLIYDKKNDPTNALKYYLESLAISKKNGPELSTVDIMISVGNTYQKLNQTNQSITYCQEALERAEKSNSIRVQIGACRCLYVAYKAAGNSNKSLDYHEQMVILEDSLHADETRKKLQQMEFANVMLKDSISKAEEARAVQEAHQEEVRIKNKTRNYLIGASLFLLLLAGGLFSRWRYTRKAKAIIEKEKDRSENLLLNILPSEIAEELKIHGKAQARDFNMVSILFTDFKGFTEQSAKLSAADLVNEINHCFEAFDGLMEKYGIEKIKTIGDSYMAAGGLPVPTDDAVKNTVLAAMEMQAFIGSRKSAMDADGKPAFEMRVGIHTGAVVAGIVGVKKFQYDIWGDTVNTASRMESNGAVGKVNISQTTYDLLKEDDDFTFENRGKVAAKGKGEIEMYFVEKRKV